MESGLKPDYATKVVAVYGSDYGRTINITLNGMRPGNTVSLNAEDAKELADMIFRMLGDA